MTPEPYQPAENVSDVAEVGADHHHVAATAAGPAAGQVVRLTATEITSAAERRGWMPASAGPRAMQLGTSLLMSEAPKFPDNDPGNGADLVIATRCQTGRELVVGDRGQILTPSAFRDSAVGTSTAGVVRARTVTSGGLKLPVEGIPALPADTDFVVTHSMVEMYTDGSPYQAARMAPRALLHRDRSADGDSSVWYPLLASFNVATVALSPDGSLAAAVEFRMNGGPHSPYAVVLVDSATGKSETVMELPGNVQYELGALTFSPDGRYLMISAPEPATTLVIDLLRRQLLQATESWEAAAFCPNGMYVVSRLSRGAVRVSHFDAATGRTSSKLEICEESDATDLYVSGLSVDLTGRRVAGITTIGVTPESRYTNGWSWRPIVLDPEGGWGELVLQTQMASGHDRDVLSVAWADPWRADSYPTLSPGFTEPEAITSDPGAASDTLNRWSEEWYNASQFVLFAAGGATGPTLPQVLPAILVLLAGVTRADPEAGRNLAIHLTGLFEAGAANGCQPSLLWREAPALAWRVASHEPVASVFP